MNFAEFDTAPCLVQPKIPQGGFPDTRMYQNLVTATIKAESEEPCGNLPSSIRSLVIRPNGDAPVCETGGYIEGQNWFQFKAIAGFADGSYKDVTLLSTWWNSDPGTASSGPGAPGKFYGMLPVTSNYEAAVLDVYASYAGMEAQSCLNVVSACSPQGIGPYEPESGTGGTGTGDGDMLAEFTAITAVGFGDYLVGHYNVATDSTTVDVSVNCIKPVGADCVFGLEVDGTLTGDEITVPAGVGYAHVTASFVRALVAGQVCKWQIVDGPALPENGPSNVSLRMVPT